MADKFNPDFPQSAIDELNSRGELGNEWKYKKYAYISIIPTGNSATVICPASSDFMRIGDTNSTGGHLSLYTDEGGARRLKPTLTSAKVVNTGGSGDYTNSYLYDIEVSFKVYTIADIDKVEKQYFRLGAEVEMKFGWKGKSGNHNTGTVIAAIYNFGFTMASDGSFDCNIKAMSAAGLFGVDDMAGARRTSTLGLSTDTVGDKNVFSNIMESLELLAREAFEMEDGDDDTSLKDNQFDIKTAKFHGNTLFFGALELEMPDEGFFDSFLSPGNDKTILFVPLGSLVHYLNKMAVDSGGLFQIGFSKGLEGKIAPPQFIPIGSANPFRTLVPLADDYSSNLKIKKIFENPDITSGGVSTDIGKIMFSIAELVKIYSDLQGTASSETGEKKPVKTMEFFNKIFSMLETDTGGILRLQIRAKDVSTKNKVPTDTSPQIMEIINRAMIPSAGITPVAHIFKILHPNSIVRDVGIASSFDSDLLVRASSKAIAEATTNAEGYPKLYGGCTGTKIKEVLAKAKTADAPITMEDIATAKADIADDGASASKVSSLSTLIRKYVYQKSQTLTVGSYGEIPMLLSLNVTIDGIDGVPYMAPIAIDRMPTVYKEVGSEFSITSIEHSFDGQGDWSTSYETVMRIKNK